MKNFLKGLWTPTKASPKARSVVNLTVHRIFVATFLPLIVGAIAWPAFGVPAIMVVSVFTQLTASYEAVQVGDVRENEGNS